MPAETAQIQPENVISARLHTLEESLSIYCSIGLSHDHTLSVSEISHILVAKQLPPSRPSKRKRFSLKEIIASEVADYEEEAGQRVPPSLLRAYGWKRSEIEAKVQEYLRKPNLRVVPKRKKAKKKAAKKKSASGSYRTEASPGDIFRQYLSEIAKHKLLSADEERSLALRIRQGDMEAQKEMAVKNLRIVVSIARKYAGRGASKEELISLGNEGLLKAVVKFDPSEGCRFSTYATWWIRQTMRRGLINDVKNVRTPAYMVERIGKIRALQKEHLALAGSELTMDELCDATVLCRKDVELAIKAGNSSSTPLYEDDNSPLADDADDPAANESAEYSEKIKNLYREIDELSDRERFIIDHRFGIGCEPETLEVIGAKVNLTRERVRQIEANTLKKLQASCGVISKEDYFTWRQGKQGYKKRKRR